MRKTIVAEVLELHGGNSQYKVGDKFYFGGAGNLITELCPKKTLHPHFEFAGNADPRVTRAILCRG